MSSFTCDYLSDSLAQAPINLDEEVAGIDRNALSIVQSSSYPKSRTTVPALKLTGDTKQIRNISIPNFLFQIPVEISPFYCCVACLHPLSLLVAPTMLNIPNNARETCDASIHFTLSDDAYKLITKNCIKVGNRVDYKWQVLLRFVAINPSKLRPTTSKSIAQVIPPLALVTANGSSVPLSEILPSNCEAEEGKRHPKAVNITDKLSADIVNGRYKQSFQITWWQTQGVYQYYYVGVYLERKFSVPEILGLFTSNRILPIESTLTFIKTKLKKNDDDDDDLVVSAVLPINLSCPVGRSRIEIPIRTVNCQHLQCFDAHHFLSMNELRSIWKCPVCDISAMPNELFCDKYFESILQEFKNNENVNEINVSCDGTYLPVVHKSDAHTIIVLGSDEDEEGERQSRKAQKSKSSKSTKTVQNSSKNEFYSEYISMSINEVLKAIKSRHTLFSNATLEINRAPSSITSVSIDANIATSDDVLHVRDIFPELSSDDICVSRIPVIIDSIL